MKNQLAPLLLVAAGIMPAGACDLCSVYNFNAAGGTRNQGFSVSVAEQFTDFGRLQDDGQKVPNPTHQYLDSLMSQVVLGYTFNDWATVQLNLPIIYRQYQRPVGFAIQDGTVSGFGDMSLVANFTPVRIEHMNSTFNWSVFGGIKFPTGNPDLLKEEFNEVEIPGAPESAVHGHDLSLGSGSYDGLVGTDIYARYQRGFFNASVQYAIRSTGAFDYRYANDLVWSGGPGFYFVLEESWTASLQFVVSGETKGLDHFQGEAAADTGITSVYLGPQFNVTWSDKMSVQVGVDLPVLLNNTALQVVPDYRLRGAFTWKF